MLGQPSENSVKILKNSGVKLASSHSVISRKYSFAVSLKISFPTSVIHSGSTFLYIMS